jgi:hypothetical protein
MKYTIYKNDVGQLMAMEGHCEFDGVVAQAIDYDAVKNTLLRAGEDQPETPHEHYWFNLGHQSNKIAEENNVLRAENARLREALEQISGPTTMWDGFSAKLYWNIAREALRGDITPDKGGE